MKNDAPAIKIKEFDILRALAIIMLMIHHSEAYGLKLFGFPLEGLNPYFEAILLGIFFFISGYFAGRSFQKENKGSISFFFSRMLRIFPPYLLAVVLYIFLLGITLKKFDLFVYLTGTHFIFAPNYAKTVLTLWYVGAIILFYLNLWFVAGKFTLHQRIDHWRGDSLCRCVCASSMDRFD